MVTEITPQDETMLDAFWNTKREPRKAPVLVPMGAVLCTITCRACGKRDTIALDWPGLICCLCRADLEGAKLRLEEALSNLPAREASASEAWVALQVSLDDETANRLSLMLADRDRAFAIWKRAGTKKIRGNEEPAEEEREAKAAYESVLAKIDRTIEKRPELKPLFLAEAAYRKEIAAVKDARAVLEIGLSEIAFITEGLPF